MCCRKLINHFRPIGFKNTTALRYKRVSVHGDTFFFHSSSKAFVKPAEAALIPLVFVDDTLTTEPDRADEKSAHLRNRNEIRGPASLCCVGRSRIENHLGWVRGRQLPAGVDMALSDASTEKALAAVTAGGAVVLARGLVPADSTVGHYAIIPVADAGLCWHAVCRSYSKPTHH